MDREPRTSPEDREGTQGPGDLAATPGPGDLAATFCATLVDEWARRGVTDAVVCPGSRNTAVSLALVGDDRLRTHVVHDERSAAFLALGLSVGSGRPVVLTCTSGSAPTHFHPAVVEADLAAVPLILVTADRPPELQGVLAPQTIDQRDLYGTAVRWYCEPGPPAPGSSPWWRDLARDALARACGSRPGPVQLDLAFREPLVGAVGALPEPEDPVGEPVPWSPTLAPGWNLTDEDVVRLVGALSGRRGVIVAGARAARSDAEREPVLALASELGWPLLADPLSGLRVPHPAVVAAFDPVLRSGVFRSSPPEVVIRLGGLVASRATAEWLRGGAAGAPLTLAVDRYGLCPDPDSTVAREFTCVPGEFAARLSGRGIEPAPQAWTGHWRAAGDAAAEGLREWLGGGDGKGCEEPFTAATLCDSLAAGSELVVASSMPVRDLESYAEPRRGVRVHSNRGTNGIDGS
ncbi:MAG: 2-succinyl-5-enolpyruvyl-6-hydroxy-3-cyclohexene-1-carboxylic-acid synthase, partial [Microthrixaceae bacterium]